MKDILDKVINRLEKIYVLFIRQEFNIEEIQGTPEINKENIGNPM